MVGNRVRTQWAVAVTALMLAVQSGCVTEAGTDWRRLAGHKAYHNGDVEQARAYFAACVEQQATDWKSQYYLGRIAMEAGDLPAARRHLDIAYTLREDRTDELRYQPEPERPIAPDLAEPRWPTLSQIIDDLCEVMYLQGDTVTLNEFLHRVARQSGNANDFIRLGRYLQRAGDPDAAIVALKKAVKLAPDDDRRPYIALADFYEAIGHDSEAVVALRRAYGIRPGPPIDDRLRAHGVVPGPTAALPVEP